jgi:hypothetical protein
MKRVLILAEERRFRQLCRGQLPPTDFDVSFASSSKAALDEIFNGQPVDLVIVHDSPRFRQTDKVLDILRSFTPEVGLIVASPLFTFWNDFKSWVADACVIASDKSGELKDTVRHVLAIKQRGVRSDLDDLSFISDWS